MRNLFWKMLLATLCLALLCTVGIGATEDAPRAVYVRSGSAGDGSVLSPVGTLADAVDLLDGKGGTIVLLNAVKVSGARTVKEQSGDLTITADGGSLVLDRTLTFAKNVNANTITIDCPITVSSSVATVFGGFNSVVFTENVSVNGKLDFYGGNDSAPNATFGVNKTAGPNKDIITELPYSITVNGGTFRRFAGGSRRPDRTSIVGSVAGDLTVTINGGTFGEGVSFTADSPIKMEQAFSLSGMSILAANATLIVNGGTFNVPVYAQGHMGEMCTNASGGSQVTKSDKKYYAIDGDILMQLNGGTFNGCEISAFQNSSVYTQIVRGNFTLEIGEDAVLADGITLDATQVKAYDGKTEIATLTYPADKNVTVKRFDVVNGEAVEYEEPLRIVCLGDSITQGSVTGGTQETDSYPAQMLVYLNGEGADRVSGREVLVSNYGCSGTRVMNYGGQYYIDMLAYNLSAEESDPDFVIIGLGTNDAGFLSIGKGQLEHFREEYTKLLTAYDKIPGVQQVYCTTATYRGANGAADHAPSTASYGAVVARSLQREVVAALAADGGKFTCIDLYALSLPEALNGTLLSSDNLHPGRSGYDIYMRKVLDAILDGKCTVENFEMTDLYVSANGTVNADCTKENPTSNLSIAFAKAAPTATIHLMDSYTYTLPGDQYCIVLPDVDSLTIVGEGAGATITTNCKYLLAQSDLVLDNLTLTTTAANAFMMQLGYNNVTLTESFSIPKKNYPMLAVGFVSFAGKENNTYYNSVESISSDKDCVINVLGGTYAYFMGGNYLYELASPIGTYSGNMTINVGENVTVQEKQGAVINGICGFNYLTGSITANLASWANVPVLTYANRGTIYAENYDAFKNTGSVTVNLADGMTNDVVVMGDFDGDGEIVFADALYLLKAYVNGSLDQPTQYYTKTTVTLRDTLAALKKLAK